MKVAVVGLGYVGLVNAVGLAALGHKVNGLDINQKKIDLLCRGEPTIQEPNLKELMQEYKDNLYFSSDPKEMFNEVDVIFIAVDTPGKEDGSCDLTSVYRCIDTIVENVTSPAVVVLKSTVAVGTNRAIKVILNKLAKVPLYLASNPEFLAQGKAVYNMLNPSRIVIGIEEEEAKNVLSELYKDFSKRDIPVLFTNYESAELIKYAANNFLAVKISFINEIALLCEKVGADVDMVAKGIGYDPRIGSGFLNAGIGFGGSCLPKDTNALSYIADHVGEPLTIVRAAIDANNKMPIKFVNKIKERFNNDIKNIKVAVLGLSFKGETNDVRSSKAISIISCLLDEGSLVVAYDKYSSTQFAKLFKENKNLVYAKSIDEAIKDADVVAILNDADEFKKMSPNDFISLMNKKPIIFDGRNLFKLGDYKDVEYHSIGRPNK